MKSANAVPRLFLITALTLALFSPFLTSRDLTVCAQEIPPWRDPVRAKHGIVASTQKLASEVGANVMRRGGNAVDASVAVALALAVVYPEAGNIGGGGFMLIRLKDGRVTAIDYREKAPAAATRNMYVSPNGVAIVGEGSSTVGYRASGVPGTVAGLEFALKKYGSGKFTWAQLVEPARQLATEGFTVPYSLARSLRRHRARLELYPDTRRIYLRDGRFYEEGETFRQPELAATLARLQRHGPREFYEGETAHLIASEMKKQGGLLTLNDLRRYTVNEREPLRGTYRGHEIITMPPPSAGGIALLEMLNILEGFDLASLGQSSSEKYHLLAETMRRAYADRATYIGDPDFVKVPVTNLLDKNYAARIRATINPERASKSIEVTAGKLIGAEPLDTTHFSVVDGEGNAVANTYTINDIYGSGVTIKGTGILLNDEMDDFTAKPGTPNTWGVIQGEQNAIEPGKRPLSSMTPTIVLRKDGSFWFGVGARGGGRITTSVLQIIVNVIDHRMNIQQAIDAPRIHHQWFPDEILFEPFGLSFDTRRALEARGHKVMQQRTWPFNIGAAEAVMIEEGTGTRLGACDPRYDGAPAGY
jgi:gamma-glutamyltranspeptidase/glutathione hydrolase